MKDQRTRTWVSIFLKGAATFLGRTRGPGLISFIVKPPFDEGPEDQDLGVNIYKGAATISWQNQRTSAHILDSEDSFDEGPEDQDMGVIISNGAVTRSWQDQRTRDL